MSSEPFADSLENKLLTTDNWRFTVRGMLALMSLLLVVSCATQSELAQSPLAPSAVAPRPLPQSAPETRAHPSKAVRASYQGDAYAGRRTASGEPYDPNALTAASSTQPIGSTIMVTNHATGRSAKVRINDRGPNAHGRSLDLSKRAAQEIGITKQGVARVSIKRVDSKLAPHSPEDLSSTAPRS
jgi:rare lipoprotein A